MKDSFINRAYAEIHNMLRGHELQYLILIDKYIYGEHPELLKTPLLRGLSKRFGAAILKLREYAPEEAMYVKLLGDKDETSHLNRRVFEDASVVATTIA